MSAVTNLSIGSTHDVALNGLRDQDDNYVNDATGTWTLYGPNDRTTQVSTGSMTYVTDSDGNYLGTIPYSVTDLLTEDATYFVKTVLTSGADRLVRWTEVLAGYGTGVEGCQPCACPLE